jgi:cytochrome b561
VVTLHVAAALKHHFVLRDDVLRRMLPFGAPGRGPGR